VSLTSDQVRQLEDIASTIQTNNRPMREITDDALAAIQAANTPAVVFVRGGALARIRKDEGERPIIEQLGEASLRGILARAAYFARVTDKSAQHVAPPKEIVQDVLALGSWPLPPLEGITETPVLRADGTVLTTPGYDAASRLVYAPARGLIVPTVPARPSPEDCRRAVDLLAEAVNDFPFENEASRANAHALMLTPVVRPAIPGQVPMALIDATKAGTGKGLLIGLASQTTTGRPAAMLAAPTREEEWHKTLLSVLARGTTFLAIDEADELASPALASVLTAPTFEGRLLGRSEVVGFPQRITWAAAGNNIRVGGDLARRCYWVRLDAKTARPWQRQGFLHPDLLAWAAERRGDLLAALLTIARAWFAAGRPAANVPQLGGFPGFLGNLETFYEQADQEAGEWEAFLNTVGDAYGIEPFTAGDLAARISDEGTALRNALPEELVNALDKKPGTFKTKLGRTLGKRAGTRYGDQGIRLDRDGEDSRSGVAIWRILCGDNAELQSSQSCGGVRGELDETTQRWAADNSATSASLQPHDTRGTA
jgi:hypothetical protein